MGFYHFTCWHGRWEIEASSVVHPHWHPLVRATLAWFTTDRLAARDDVGLTSSILSCDRMESCYRVVDDDEFALRPWIGSREQAATDPHVQMDLHRFSKPDTWAITATPVRVEAVG